MKSSPIALPSGKSFALCAACACLGLWGAMKIASAGAVPVSFLWLIFCFFLLTLSGGFFFSLHDRRLQSHACVLGFLFALSFALGYQMQFHAGVGGFAGFGLVCLTAAALAPGTAGGIVCLYRSLKALGKRPAHTKNSPRKAFCFYGAVIFLCWLPVFLAYYPGLFAYDVMFQIPQVTAHAYHTHHPLIHTLLLGGFYKLGELWGSPTLGMALYTLLQMILHALALAYSVSYLYRLGCPRIFRIACLLLFALFPIHSILAVSMTKDVLYTSLILVSLTLLHQAWLSPKKLKNKCFIFSWVLVVALTCLMRNNGILIFAAVCAGLLLLLKKKPEAAPRLLALTLAGILLFGICSLALSNILDAQPGPIKEALSVPLQQIGRVYSLHKEELEAEEREKIEEFIPGVYAYVPTFADHIKAFANVGTSNLTEFIRFWAKLMVAYPEEYVDAFLLNCQGYWFMNDLSQSSHYGVGLEERQGYLLTDTKEGFGIEHTSYFPALERLLESLFSANEYLQIPILAQSCSLAVYTWLLGFVFFAASYDRRRDILLCGTALLGAFSFLLFGPCAIVRYQYPLIAACPVLLCLLFGAKESPPCEELS